jgi:predicted XRE-type DNA-binding protein
VTPGSGNIFADIGVADPEMMLAKANVLRQMHHAIKSRKLSQAKVAALLKLDQPKVSALLRGHTRGFTLDRLFRLLNALGQNVEISITPANGKTSTITVKAN